MAHIQDITHVQEPRESNLCQLCLCKSLKRILPCSITSIKPLFFPISVPPKTQKM